MMPERPIAVLLSGGGTNLQNLIDERAKGNLRIRIVKVIANKHGLKGIERAEKAGLSVEVVVRKEFPDTDSFSERIFEKCHQAGAKLVCLAGFLQLLRIPDDFIHRV